MYLLGVDAEFGGLAPECSLLTTYFAVIDSNFEEVNSLRLLVKPDPVNGKTQYVVEAEGLAVNGINLVEHEQTAIPYKEAKRVLYDWLFKAFTQYGRLMPFGNGINGDIERICSSLISKDSWNNFTHNCPIDTIVLGQAAKLRGKLPEDQSLALSKVTQYLGYEVDESKVHTDKYDVELNTFWIKWLLTEG